jgi:hypothetical protein
VRCGGVPGQPGEARSMKSRPRSIERSVENRPFLSIFPVRRLSIRQVAPLGREVARLGLCASRCRDKHSRLAVERPKTRQASTTQDPHRQVPSGGRETLFNSRPVVIPSKQQFRLPLRGLGLNHRRGRVVIACPVFRRTLSSRPSRGRRRRRAWPARSWWRHHPRQACLVRSGRPLAARLCLGRLREQQPGTTDP